MRVGAAAERRLGGRDGPVAGDLADAARRRASTATPAAAAELVARGVVEGSLRPADDLPRRRRVGAPPILDELILVAPGADAAALDARPPSAASIIGEGANIARTLSNRAANDVSPEVLADEARAIAEQHGLWIDVIEPGAGDRARAWACSWPSAGAATTRRG